MELTAMDTEETIGKEIAHEGKAGFGASLREEFPQVFRETLPLPPETRDKYARRITLQHGEGAPAQRPYPISLFDRKRFQMELQELESKGYITRSRSPHAAPKLYVDKKDGGRRLCIDYRRLNKITVRERTNPLRVEELMDTLGNSRMSTTLDFRSGYWHASREKTALTTCFGQYPWKVMPFGLKNAPAVFRRYLTDVLYDLLNKCVVLYIDDILIFSSTECTTGVWRRLKEHQLMAKYSKCQFGVREVCCRGQILVEATRRPDPKKVAAILNWKAPTTVKEVQSFMGFANFLRPFVAHFAQVATPLHTLTTKNRKWGRYHAEQYAFDGLKPAIIATTMLYVVDPTLPFVV
eukprot:CAMPEP_0184741404 /NCGR_PEP_ID=MMETSP0315-20130426/4420_1 /TAXON_ID=101924 /ORGANISM="Rhodosorus marinus, Strain UTEX LB 2760" /LENGTH=350 /DNA_ID=CAMNT_0027211655 /DNA_START=881 /DNA_END=1933 /DNA_ORIENTATION=-